MQGQGKGVVKDPAAIRTTADLPVSSVYGRKSMKGDFSRFTFGVTRVGDSIFLLNGGAEVTPPGTDLNVSIGFKIGNFPLLEEISHGHFRHGLHTRSVPSFRNGNNR